VFGALSAEVATARARYSALSLEQAAQIERDAGKLRWLDGSPIDRFHVAGIAASDAPFASPFVDDYHDYFGFCSARRVVTTRTWTVAEAKAKLSEVIERARKRGPQTVTRNGRPAVVIVAAEEWERRARRTGNLAEFFAASPLRGSALTIERVEGGLRELEL
jgi:prevent-host-death family protein